ncbi:DNA alkylation repair protein [Kitasatospora sp. NPDC050467]|uniref:DNA alkylation repair protein n=1 Tax=Kitasatospora sp. NPDC050467 TaxID=3364053 RepID=UPI00378F1E45
MAHLGDPSRAPEPAAVVAGRLRAALEDSAVPGRAEAERAYLKSGLDHLGVPVPAMRALVRNTLRAAPGLDRAGVLELAEELWAPPVHESRSCALLLLEYRAELLLPEDTAFLERLLRECATWAHVDLLASKVAGALLLRAPDTAADFLRWSRDEEQWVRRGGVLTYVLALRDPGEFPHHFEEFTALADPLLTDPRFFVRKAVGWTLREGVKHHPAEVTGWLGRRLDRVSGLTLREAIRPVDEAAAGRLLAAHRELHGRRPRG